MFFISLTFVCKPYVWPVFTTSYSKAAVNLSGISRLVILPFECLLQTTKFDAIGMSLKVLTNIGLLWATVASITVL